MSEPLHVTWDRTVIHSTGPGDDTIVCCLDQQRRPVALFLDDELREALALSLLDPSGDMDQADDTDEPAFAVVFDRPDPGRVYAWGPFADRAAAARFAEFVHTEIDPARVTTWEDAEALPGVRLSDPVAELLAWRASVAQPRNAEPGDEWVRCAHPHCPNGEWYQHATTRGWAHHLMDTWLCPEHAALPAAPTS